MLGFGAGTITENSLCAEGGSKYDACQGDSGGPLIIKGDDSTSDALVGVVTWGAGCAEDISEIFPGVYSRVSSALSWIEQEVPAAVWSLGVDVMAPKEFSLEVLGIILLLVAIAALLLLLLAHFTIKHCGK
jgi:secreted trypsin-like serine protease